jgi:hypothetical protein
VDLGVAGLPYAPFTAALRVLVRELGASEVRELVPGGSAGELAGLAGQAPPSMLAQLPGAGFVRWCPVLAHLPVAASLGLSNFAVAIATGADGVDARTGRAPE